MQLTLSATETEEATEIVIPMKTFLPDYRHMVSVATNHKPARMPFYEHIVSPEIMGRVLGVELHCPDPSDGSS